MDLTYSEEQKLIQQQAREFFERECPLDTVRAAWASADGLPESLWRRMAHLGWLGALLPEAHGGMELGHTDLSRILEEMGRGLLPGPYLANLVAAEAVRYAGNAEQQAALLPSLVRGETRLALARVGEGGRTDGQGGNFSARAAVGGTGKAYVLDGTKLAVPGLSQAQRVVVLAHLAGAPGSPRATAAFLLDPAAAGVAVTPVRTLEGGLRAATLTLTGVQVTAADRLAGADGGSSEANGRALAERLDALLDLALVFDALGGMQRVTEMTVEYARLREAFGNPIGTYQAVKHKCADMLYAVENLRALAIWAAWVLDVPREQSNTDPRSATALARATAIEGYDTVIRHGTQVHGAIAVTEEHDMHLFAKRAKTLALAYGGQSHYAGRILAANGLL